MTQQEKDQLCKELCARYKTPGMHSLFCPYTMDRWKAGKLEVSGGKMETPLIYKEK